MLSNQLIPEISQRNELVVAYRYRRPMFFPGGGQPWVDEYFIPSEQIRFSETGAGMSDRPNNISQLIFTHHASAVTRVTVAKPLVKEIRKFLKRTSSESREFNDENFTKSEEFIKLFSDTKKCSLGFWEKCDEKENDPLQKALVKYILEDVLPPQTHRRDLIIKISKLDAIEQQSILDCIQVRLQHIDKSLTILRMKETKELDQESYASIASLFGIASFMALCAAGSFVPGLMVGLLSYAGSNLFSKYEHDQLDKKMTSREQRLDYVVSALEKLKLSVSTDSLIRLIQHDTSVEEFYDQITKKGTCFNYDLNKPTYRNKWSLLHWVCKEQNIPLAKALIRSGVFINPVRAGENTPLDDALKGYNLELIQLLIENGGVAFGSLNTYITEIEEKLNCSHEYYLKNKLLILKQYLQQDHLQEKFRPLEERFYLHNKVVALENMSNGLLTNDVELVKSGLQTNMISANCLSSFTKTCTRSAAEDGQLEMVKLLVQYGGEIIEDDGRDAEGITTAMAARKAGHADTADYLDEVQRKRYQCLREVVEEELSQKNDSVASAMTLR